MASSTEVKSHHSMSSRGRFELPVLGPLDSLTNGTNIPPPLDSPLKETAPELPSKVAHENVSAAADGAPTNGNANGTSSDRLAVVTEYNGGHDTNGHLSAASPSSQRRPGSIRRFLSRNSMYHNYNESKESHEQMSIRAATPTGDQPPYKKRRSSWFARLTGSGLSEPAKNKRASVVYEEKGASGPPPPKLPELSQLKARIGENGEGSLGGEDLFKNIK